MEEIKYLEMFRDLRINKMKLFQHLKGNFSALKTKNLIEVSRENILRLLEYLNLGKISVEELQEWIDAVWYMEVFKYKESEAHCISSIISELEEVDIDINKISTENIHKYLDALIDNRELA